MVGVETIGLPALVLQTSFSAATVTTRLTAETEMIGLAAGQAMIS
jgi:hypothetical protein